MSTLAERIRAEAATVTPMRVLVTVASAVFYTVGLVVGLAIRAVWAALVWVWAAILVGFHDGRGGAS